MPIRFSILALLLYMFTFNAHAGGVLGSMQGFWDGLGGMSNVSGPTAYQGQSAGYYTLGNLYARTPVKNVYPLSIQLPSARGGCGGIDIFAGSFSFINADQFIKTGKAIVNNAKGFAFQLALETISPVITEKLEELQNKMQEINSMNINSCETAAALVGGMWPKHDRASATICATMGNKKGIFDDYAQAKHECESGGKRAETSKKVEDRSDAIKLDDVNIAWKALRESNFFGAGGNFDKQLAELFMTLSGTVIILAPKNDDDGPKFEFVTARIAHNDVISTLMDGGQIKTHRCDEADKCLNMIKEGNHHQITAGKAFKTRVQTLLESMISKIIIDEELDKQELALLNMTSIPIYRVLNVYAAYSGAGTIFELPVYSEAISLHILYAYLNDILRQVTVASDRLVLGSEDQLAHFKDGLKDARTALAEREIKTNQSYTTLMQMVDRTMFVEGILAKEMGESLAESLQWSRQL